MALSLNDIKTIETAIRLGTLIQFNYYPNKYPTLTIERGLRKIIPLSLFVRNGKAYFFGLFYSGASVSKSTSKYRLFFQSNMYNLKRLSSSGRVINQSAIEKDYNSNIFKMILNNEIE